MDKYIDLIAPLISSLVALLVALTAYLKGRTAENTSRDLKGKFKDLLREMEMYKFAFENYENAIVFVNQSGVIERINLKAELITGYSRMELIGSPIERLIPNRYEMYHRIARMDYVRIPVERPMGKNQNIVMLHRDGSELNVFVSLIPQPTDKGVAVMVTVREKKERRGDNER